MSEMRLPMQVRPARFKDGERVFEVPKSMVEKSDEMFLGLQLVCNRRLFGDCFRSLMPEYFASMGRDSGVMIRGFVPSDKVLPEMTFPGDIDLLIIPYEGDELIVSQTLAIELKAVRATYAKQGKSPNQYGFSQATAMLERGFPFAAVGHLIVSDSSPEDKWRTMLATRVIDAKADTVEKPWAVVWDMLPSDLIHRCFRRLEVNSKQPLLGLFAAYMGNNETWSPNGKAAERNPKASVQTMEAIARYYYANANSFFDTPRY